MIAWGLAIVVSFASPDTGLLSIAPLNAIFTAMLVYVALYRLIYRGEVEKSTNGE